MRRRLRRQGPDDAGFTLVELLVVGALMSLIGILVSTTMVGGMRTAARGEKRVDDVAQAQRALLAITADVRASRGFAEATPTRLRLLASTTGSASSTPADPPEQVTYELTAAGNLVQTRESGTGSTPATFTPTGTPQVRTLATRVLQPAASGRALFTALSVIDSRKQCPTGPTVSTLGVPVTGANLTKIYAIDIWLSLNSGANLGSPPLTVPGGAVVSSGADLELDAATLPSAGIGQGC